MAVEDMIARGISPMEGPLDSYGRALAIKGAVQEQGMNRQRMEAGELSLEQLRQTIADDAEARKLFSENANPTPDQIMTRLGPGKGSTVLRAMHEAQKAMYERETQAITLNQQRASRMAQIAAGIKDQDTYQAGIMQALREKLIPPESLKTLPAAYDPEAVKQFGMQALTENERQTQARANLDMDWKRKEEERKAILFPDQQRKAKADATGAEQNVAEKQAQDLATQLANAPDQAARDSILATIPYGVAKRFHGLTDRKAILQAAMAPKDILMNQRQMNTPAELAIVANDPNSTPQERASAQAALKTLEKHALASRPVVNVHGGMAPVPQTAATGDEFLKTLPPARAAKVRAAAEGRITPPSPNSRSQDAQQLLNELMQYEPGFNEQRAQLRKAFTTGPDGRNIGALNTATVHLGQLHDAALAMKNGSWQPGNELYNWAASKFGSDKVTNYNYVMNALAGETASALKGNATDPEIAHVSATLASNMSPDQALGIAKSGLHVMGAKLNTYLERYEQQLGGRDPIWSPVLPSAKAVFSRFGVNPTEAGQNPGGMKNPYRR